jgi:hypothetical protein
MALFPQFVTMAAKKIRAAQNDLRIQQKRMKELWKHGSWNKNICGIKQQWNSVIEIFRSVSWRGEDLEMKMIPFLIMQRVMRTLVPT